MAIADVGPADVHQWVATLMGGPLEPSTIRWVLTILDQLFDAAIDLGLVAVNPTDRVRLPRITRTEMRSLPPSSSSSSPTPTTFDFD